MTRGQLRNGVRTMPRPAKQEELEDMPPQIRQITHKHKVRNVTTWEDQEHLPMIGEVMTLKQRKLRCEAVTIQRDGDGGHQYVVQWAEAPADA